jgi:DNA-binding MarR family transcriptional regulator
MTASPSSAKRSRTREAATAPRPTRRARVVTPIDGGGVGGQVILRTADSPYYQLWVLTNLTAKPFSKFSARFHMNLTHWRVMLTVADHPGITAQALSEYSGLDKMVVSRGVRGLEEQGRLVREGNEADRRLRHLRLTAKGWDVYARIARAASAREAEIYSVLGARELAELRRLLAKLSTRARLSAESSQQKP